MVAIEDAMDQGIMALLSMGKNLSSFHAWLIHHPYNA
jgi:hypothetical protein